MQRETPGDSGRRIGVILILAVALLLLVRLACEMAMGAGWVRAG